MNRSRMFLLAAIAFLVAIGVAAFTYQTLSKRLKPVDDTMEIVVAELPVSLGARLTKADVRLAAYSKGSVPDGSFSSVSEVIGRGVLDSLVPNEPILAKDLAAEGSGAGLSSTIPEGMRLITLKVNDVSGVAGFVGPGSRVDVILAGSPTSGNIEMAKVILENIQVSAGDQNILTDDSGRPLNVQNVSVLATPEQATALTLAQTEGKIQLILRNPLDLAEAKPNAIRRDQLLLGSGSSFALASTSAPVVRPAVARTAPRQQTNPPIAPSAPAAIPVPAQPEVPPKEPRKPFEVINGNDIKKIEF